MDESIIVLDGTSSPDASTKWYHSQSIYTPNTKNSKKITTPLTVSSTCSIIDFTKDIRTPLGDSRHGSTKKSVKSLSRDANPLPEDAEPSSGGLREMCENVLNSPEPCNSNSKRKMISMHSVDLNNSSDPIQLADPYAVEEPKIISLMSSSPPRETCSHPSRSSALPSSGGSDFPTVATLIQTSVNRKSSPTRGGSIFEELLLSKDSGSAGDGWDTGPTKKKKSKLNSRMLKESHKLTRQQAREATLLQKELEKEAKRLEKQRKKEERELAKQKERELRSANRVRTSRSECAEEEMIVDVNGRLLDETEIGPQLREAFDAHKISYNPLPESSDLTVYWRRRVTCEWNEDRAEFVTVEPKICEEIFVLEYMMANELVDLVRAKALLRHADILQQQYPGKRIILLIEGLEKYYKKQKQDERRQFARAVRQASGASLSQDSTGEESRENPKREHIEEELISLQLMKRYLIVHTTGSKQSAETILQFTMDIATRPYKTKRNANFNFWANAHVRCGSDAAESWLRMLQEIQLVTPRIAESIVEVYPTVRSLYDAYFACESIEEGEMLLADIEVERVAIPGQRPRRIGPAMSKRIYHIFMGKDPSQVLA
ncbi:uncharacterized protein VTP21DRAFT_681 [Calcarisporiella thermophila]|uniref:uncharacterized protein n=1 Tax=Calcarisporiella thermophila TaxID=911321 RepID=UPI0037420C3F